jgi:hypothetical protein
MRWHLLNGVELPIEQYGSEAWWKETGAPAPPASCHDCAVSVGQYHRPGCDMERCPHDGSQALQCGCLVSEQGTLRHPD